MHAKRFSSVVGFVATVLVGCLGCVAAGCATAPVGVVPEAHARDFQALAVGTSWTYRATPGRVEPQTLKIVAFDKGYFVDDRGGRLAPRTDGLFDGKRFLLQDPLVVGHAWSAKADDQSLERYTVDATDVAVTVPAGTFSGCVQVTGRQMVIDEKSKQPVTLAVTSTWAPGVGVVRVEFVVQTGGAAPVTTSLTELVAFSPTTPATTATAPTPPPTTSP